MIGEPTGLLDRLRRARAGATSRIASDEEIERTIYRHLHGDIAQRASQEARDLIAKHEPPPSPPSPKRRKLSRDHALKLGAKHGYDSVEIDGVIFRWSGTTQAPEIESPLDAWLTKRGDHRAH